MNYIKDKLMSIFVTLALLILAIQVVFFLFAFAFKTDKVTDLAYGLTFVVVVWIAYLVSDTKDTIKLLLTILVTLWGLRLAGYLLLRILKMKKDERFSTMRQDFFKFRGFWLLQAVSIFVIIAPVLVVLNRKYVLETNVLVWVGLSMALFGLVIEAVADIQKFNFKNNPANKDKWIDSGLWRYSRHPNYFGEIMMWLGVAVVAICFMTGIEYISLVSPFYIASLLLFVSGVPLLEKRWDAKYKGNKKYEDYKNSTSMIIPWFRL